MAGLRVLPAHHCAVPHLFLLQFGGALEPEPADADGDLLQVFPEQRASPSSSSFSSSPLMWTADKSAVWIEQWELVEMVIYEQWRWHTVSSR
jgi:hypothetical protein